MGADPLWEPGRGASAGGSKPGSVFPGDRSCRIWAECSAVSAVRLSPSAPVEGDGHILENSRRSGDALGTGRTQPACEQPQYGCGRPDHEYSWRRSGI